MSKASPGDIICTGKGTSGSNSHVAIYLGGGKVVECCAGYGVGVNKAPTSVRQIVHFSCLPTNNSASFGKSTNGTWVQSGTGYKFKVGSSYLTNRFQNINGDFYYFDANGMRATGWKKIFWKGATRWFFFGSDGVMRTGWQEITYRGTKKWFFFDDNGVMLTGLHELSWKGKKAVYYFDPDSGVMQTGKVKLKVTFNSSGQLTGGVKV
jgi:glucan-binding YG repeat protein